MAGGLGQSDTRPAAVFRDELDTCQFKGSFDRSY